jgi:hypothetical protein
MPQKMNLARASTPQNIGEITATLIASDEPDALRADYDLITGVTFSRDGKAVFLLYEDGYVRRIAVPDLKETANILLKTECRPRYRSKERFCTTSAEGLVVRSRSSNSRGQQLLWVLDENTLGVKQRIVTPVGDTATSPSLSTAYCLGAGLSVIDLKTGRVLHTTNQWFRNPSEETDDRLRGFSCDVSEGFGAVVTPDGKYALLTYDKDRLLRFRIDGQHLIFEEATGEIRAAYWNVCPASDSQRVVVGQYNGAWTYKTQDLSEPLASFRFSKDSLEFHTVDPASANVYARSSGSYGRAMMYEYSNAGESLRTIPRLPSSMENWHFHPQGGAALVHNSRQAHWVTLSGAPKDLAARPQSADPLQLVSPLLEVDLAKYLVPEPGWEANVPAPEEGVVFPMLGQPITADDVVFIPLGDETERIETVTWAADGDLLVLLYGGKGGLWKMPVDDPDRSSRLEIPDERIVAFEVTQAGLAAFTKSARRHGPASASNEREGTLRVLDPGTLRAKAGYRWITHDSGIVPGRRTSGRPGSPYLLMWDEYVGFLWVIDLEAGKMVDYVDSEEWRRRCEKILSYRAQIVELRESGGNLHPTSDGLFLFQQQKEGSLNRFVIRDGRLLPDAMTNDPANTGKIMVPAFSPYVLVGRDAARNARTQSLPEVRGQIRAYAIDDLSQPEAIVPQQEEEASAVIDSQRRRIITCERIRIAAIVVGIAPRLVDDHRPHHRLQRPLISQPVLRPHLDQPFRRQAAIPNQLLGIGKRHGLIGPGMQNGRARLYAGRRPPCLPCRAQEDRGRVSCVDVHRNRTATSGADHNVGLALAVYGNLSA